MCVYTYTHTHSVCQCIHLCQPQALAIQSPATLRERERQRGPFPSGHSPSSEIFPTLTSQVGPPLIHLPLCTCASHEAVCLGTAASIARLGARSRQKYPGLFWEIRRHKSYLDKRNTSESHSETGSHAENLLKLFKVILYGINSDALYCVCSYQPACFIPYQIRSSLIFCQNRNVLST